MVVRLNEWKNDSRKNADPIVYIYGCMQVCTENVSNRIGDTKIYICIGIVRASETITLTFAFIFTCGERKESWSNSGQRESRKGIILYCRIHFLSTKIKVLGSSKKVLVGLQIDMYSQIESRVAWFYS